jgi:hypothetical protein
MLLQDITQNELTTRAARKLVCYWNEEAGLEDQLYRELHDVS